MAIRNESLVVSTEQDFCSTERVLDPLIEQPGEGHAEEFVPQEIQRTHRLRLHGIDEPAAVDEFTFSARDGVIKFGEVLRWHGQIRIQDHQDIPLGLPKSFSYGIAFPSSVLHQKTDIFMGISPHDTLN